MSPESAPSRELDRSVSRAPTSKASLPNGPDFLTLAGIHLRGLWREFPIAWIAFGGFALLLPAITLLYRGESMDPMDLSASIMSIVILVSILGFLTIAIAFLWPEAVWRNLPPGSRSVMDSLPATRRAHRMARVAAGLTLPIVMALSIALTVGLLRTNPGFEALPAGGMGLGGEGSGVVGLLIALGSLTGAYLLSSALAIRFGRPVLALFMIVAGGTLLIFVFVIAGWEDGARALQQGLFLGEWAPGRTLLLAPSAQPDDLGPMLLWLGAFLALCAYWAGRYDRA